MPTNPVIKHQKFAMNMGDVFSHLVGVPVTTSASIANAAHTPLIFVTTKPMSAGHLIQTLAYSYDGIYHTESYTSDI